MAEDQRSTELIVDTACPSCGCQDVILLYQQRDDGWLRFGLNCKSCDWKADSREILFITEILNIMNRVMYHYRPESESK